MTQQMQYAYWQRMRQQQVYRAYIAGYGTKIEEYEGLCFTAEEANSSVKLQNITGLYQTSTDGQNWIDYDTVNAKPITLSNVGDKVYFAAKTTNETCWNDNTSNKKFIMTGKIAASGNIQSLLDKECKRLDVPEKCYSCIFRDCQQLTKPPMLPATTLDNQCYDAMFLNCSWLATAPVLPADILVQRCYQFMFHGCSSLTVAPELPAIAIAPYCYDTMFGNCTSLTSVPTLSSEVLYKCCYMNMFNGCSSLRISDKVQDGNIVLALKTGTVVAEDWNTNMFEGTICDFEGNPMIGKTYRCYQ